MTFPLLHQLIKLHLQPNWHKPFANKDNYGPRELIVIDINGKILSTEIYKERIGFESFWDDKDLKYIRTKKNPCQKWFYSDEAKLGNSKEIIGPVFDISPHLIQKNNKVIFKRIFYKNKEADKPKLVNHQIWIGNTDGTDERKLTDLDFLSWTLSRDNKKIYYVWKGSIREFTIQNSKNVKIINRNDVLDFDLSSENKRIIFSTKNRNIYIANIDGTNIKTLTFDSKTSNEIMRHGFMFITENEVIFRKIDWNGILVYNLDSLKQKQITLGKNNKFDIVGGSNDRKKIIFLERRKFWNSADFIWTVNIDGTGLKQIFPKKILGIF